MEKLKKELKKFIGFQKINWRMKKVCKFEKEVGPMEKSLKLKIEEYRTLMLETQAMIDSYKNI